jgi:glycosyltransferase involved in cell wall biosynthesis
MIIFYVTSLSVNVASVRYRAMLPALYLLRRGVAAEVRSGRIPDDVLKQAHCLVLVKAFSEDAVSTAISARRFGVPIILDVCDDIFVESYGAATGRDQSQHYFRAMAALASAVVTPTQHLAETVRSVIPDSAVHVIPDLAERFDDIRALRSLYGSVRRRKRWFSLRKVFKKLRIARHRVKRALNESVDYTQDAASSASERIILWFGNHGTSHSDSGMTQILWVAPTLQALSRKHNIKLVVVSDNPEKFRRYIQPLPIKTEYVEWTATTVYRELKRASVTIVPFGTDRFSRSKSPNRIVLSLSRNVPVVCTDHPSLGPLRDVVSLDEWERGIDRYLSEPELVKAHLRDAASVLEREFHGDRVAELWREAVRSVEAQGSERSPKRSLLCFLKSSEDANALVPICCEVENEIDVRFVVFSDLAQDSPDTLAEIRQTKSRVFFIHPHELSRLDATDLRLAADIAVVGVGSMGAKKTSLLKQALEAAGTPTLMIETHLATLKPLNAERYLAAVRQGQRLG